MIIPTLLAHGALGNLDEVIFLLVGVIFLGMMGISWFRSQNMPNEEEPNFNENPSQESQPDHFELQ